LIMFAQCPNDLAAILVARDATRPGQAVEVWRGDRLVYRVGLRSDKKDDALIAPPKDQRLGKFVARFARLRTQA
jgi:hypothetical protein